MQVACSGLIVGQYTPPRSLGAMYMCATLCKNIHHSVRSMLLAIDRRLTAFNIEARISHAGNMQAALGANVNHTVFGMLFAIICRLAALKIETRVLGAGVM